MGALDPNFFLLSDFSVVVGKDKYPDIDGLIRLRDGNGKYLNKYLHYQLKSTEQLKNKKYACSRGIFDYLLDTNVPTLLFVVAVKSKGVFWFFLDKKAASDLGLQNDRRGRTLDLSNHEIGNNSLQLNQLWQKYAKHSNYEELNNSLNKIASDFHENVVKCVGLLYLLQRVSKDKLPELFSKILNVELDEVNLIIKRLYNADVITGTPNLYLLENEQLGIESLFDLLQTLDLRALEAIFENKDDRKIALRQLSNIEHSAVNKYLSGLTSELLELAKKSDDNDDLLMKLELLEEYIHRVPKEGLLIVKAVIGADPQSPRLLHEMGHHKIYGKSHDDLIEKSIDLLERVRYLETKEALKILVGLSKHGEQKISSKAIKALEHLAQYNLFVLKKVDYYAQEMILAEIKQWSNKKIKENTDALLVIAKEMLEPSFEGHSMPDYKTFTLHSGPLVVTDRLKNLRKHTIALLQKLYHLSTELNYKAKALQTLQGATQTPHGHLYGEDMEQMVWDDTNTVIDFYLEILPDAENEIIQDIEEQKVWFVRRFTKKPPTRIAELEEALRSNEGYSMFRVFVGYEGKLDPDYDFNRDRETRAQKVQQFISDISEGNFDEWRKKILSVIKNYSGTEPGSYSYFETFLAELGQNKPDIALRLIKENEKELEPFLISLLSGIWKSKEQDKAKAIISCWVGENKHLFACAFIFAAVEEMDEKLLRQILDKAKEVKDVRALNNVLRSILRNYPNPKSLRAMFLETIEALTRNENTWWINNLWFKGDSILPELTEEEFDTVLDGLILVPQVDFHVEEILRPVAERYPRKIIEFFHRRVLIKAKIKRDIDDRYDGVPFNFHKLGEMLKQHEKIIVPIILEWYGEGGKEHNWLFKWEASHLFEEIFPGFSPVLESSLIDIIHRGDKKSRSIVFSVLSKYKGGDFLWGVIRSLVNKYANTKEYEEVQGHLFGYLSQTGVVSGEDGFVRAYQGKKQALRELKKDKDKKFVAFIKAYEDYLDKRIAFEQKRTDEEVELMKRGLGR